MQNYFIRGRVILQGGYDILPWNERSRSNLNSRSHTDQISGPGLQIANCKEKEERGNWD